jgi:hypothetical protein
MSKSKKIAKYARMASNEAHEEYMGLDNGQLMYYYRDILSEMIDKFDRIEAMASDNWYKKTMRKWKYR